MPIRILIADDDAAIRRLFRRLLEAHPDWQVCGEAVNGVDAIEKVALESPDLAILDLGMPLKNGIDAARSISQSNPALPLWWRRPKRRDSREELRRAGEAKL